MPVIRRAARLLVALTAGATLLTAPAPASAKVFPGVIELPDGWQPEGVASGLAPATGEATRIDLGGATVVNGDGIYLEETKRS